MITQHQNTIIITITSQQYQQRQPHKNHTIIIQRQLKHQLTIGNIIKLVVVAQKLVVPQPQRQKNHILTVIPLQQHFLVQ